MASRLTTDKSLAMKELHVARYSERRIAEILNTS